MTIGTCTKVALKLAKGDFGYGQDDRKTALADNGKLGVAGLREPGDTDCSYGIGIIYYLAGFILRKVLDGTFYTGNIAQKLHATGMFDLVDVRKLSLAQIKAKVREGDSLLGPGHIVYGLGGGKVVSFETTEKGRSTGGKKGDQTGREGRVRDIYLRSASSRAKAKSKTGWATIIRPKSPATFIGQVLAAYGKGKSTSAAQARLTARASWDGPRIAEFVTEWAQLDKGVTLVYPGHPLEVQAAGHAFVILGSTISKMNRRMEAGLPEILAHPASKVLVTGGVRRGAVTEAVHMRDWLTSHGVEAGRILIENGAGSTIGNATRSVPILIARKLTSYTLVSDASHLRRAAILFRAALAKVEMVDNVRRGITATAPIAFDDYGSRPKSATLPIDADTRAEYAGYVASVLGVTAQYKAAL